MKVICGDISDNLKGIDGIGENTLLKLFPDIKFRKMTVREICSLADKINKERIENKKKPLKALDTLLNNLDRLVINHKLMNLNEPFLNENAEIELNQLDYPLSDEDRNSKKLYNLMIEDDFLSVYGGSFSNYVESFYPVIMFEKQLLKEYISKNKNQI